MEIDFEEAYHLLKEKVLAVSALKDDTCDICICGEDDNKPDCWLNCEFEVNHKFFKDMIEKIEHDCEIDYVESTNKHRPKK